MRLVALFSAVFAALVSGSVSGQSGSVLPAPLQVEGVVRDLRGDHQPNTLGIPRVMINLGATEGRPWSDQEDSGRMTLLGTTGVMTAYLEEVVKVCETLCGDDAEECHYEGRLVPAGNLDSIGIPVAALPGERSLLDFASLEDRPPRSDVGPGELSDAFAAPIWPEDNPADTRHRFRRSGNDFTVEYAWGSVGGQTVPAGECRFYDRGPVTRMACAGVEALIAEGLPILVSFPDYNSAGADLIAAFTHDNQTYYVVRLALKVQTVYGLLFRDAAGWHARFHPRDYALLC